MIQIISGTNQAQSQSGLVAEFYREQLANHGYESNIVDLADLPTDFTFSALYGNQNEGFNILRDNVEQADALVFVLPEYNGSYPGAMKAFLDGFHYPSRLTGKPVALVGLSGGGSGNALGLSHFADVMSFFGADVLGLRVKIPFAKKNFSEGNIQDSFIYELFQQQLSLFVRYASKSS